MDEDKIVGVDTALINDGKFQFSGKEYLNDIGILSIGNYPEKVIYQPVFLEKGNISVSMDEKKLGGTNLNDLYHSYNYRMNKYTNEFQEISKLDKNKNYVKPGSPKDKKHIEIGIYSVNFKKNNINSIYYKPHESFGRFHKYLFEAKQIQNHYHVKVLSFQHPNIG